MTDSTRFSGNLKDPGVVLFPHLPRREKAIGVETQRTRLKETRGEDGKESDLAVQRRRLPAISISQTHSVRGSAWLGRISETFVSLCGIHHVIHSLLFPISREDRRKKEALSAEDSDKSPQF